MKIKGKSKQGRCSCNGAQPWIHEHGIMPIKNVKPRRISVYIWLLYIWTDVKSHSSFAKSNPDFEDHWSWGYSAVCGWWTITICSDIGK